MIRVALVCHFSNAEVRARLKWGLRRQGADHDFAIWNTEFIKEVSKRDDVELHVISPHWRMRRFTQEFSIGRVRYHFFKPDIPVLNISWAHLFSIDRRTNYWLTRHIVQRWIRKINPDIVNLVGAENPHYSASILGLKGYPVFVTMQGIYSNPDRFKTEQEDVWHSRCERLIHAENRYFGLNAEFMKSLIRRDAPDAFLFWNRPLNRNICLPKFDNRNKEYDFVFYSRMVATKGPQDLIKAAAIVHQRFPSVTVRLIGRGNPEFEMKIAALIESLRLQDVIIRSDGYREHDDLMREVQKARCHVLPTYIDTIPCTIFEGLRLGLPFIGYETGDIPKLNMGEERVLLTRPGDIEGLAANMIRVLAGAIDCEELVRKSMAFVEKCFSNQANMEQTLSIYKAVINNYREGEPIPEELLYDGYLKSKVETK